MATIAPIHPGEVLLEDFLSPLEVTQHHLAVSIGVPPRRTPTQPAPGTWVRLPSGRVMQLPGA